MLGLQGTFGERLDIAIKTAGKTQRQAAEEVGINEVSMSRYIRNQRRPDVSTVASMVKALHCDAGWLLGIQEDASEGDRAIMSYRQVLMTIREFSKTWTTQQRLSVIKEILTMAERNEDEYV